MIDSARTEKADVAYTDSREHLKVHLEQENTQRDGCNSETARAKKDTAAEENSAVSESEQKLCRTYKALLQSGVDEMYKSPAIPKAKIFQAVVSCVGHDGTIYIIPKSLGKKKIRLCLNVTALVYRTVADMCSSIHVLYQNTVLEDSCWGGLLLEVRGVHAQAHPALQHNGGGAPAAAWWKGPRCQKVAPVL